MYTNPEDYLDSSMSPSERLTLRQSLPKSTWEYVYELNEALVSANGYREIDRTGKTNVEKKLKRLKLVISGLEIRAGIKFKIVKSEKNRLVKCIIEDYNWIPGKDRIPKKLRDYCDDIDEPAEKG